MRVASFVLASVLVAGCSPQNAKITGGEYTAFLGVSNSISYQRQNLQYDKFDRQYYIDCRVFDAAGGPKENEADRLGEGTGEQGDVRLPICEGDQGGQAWPPTEETWMGDDGFLVLGSTLDPWRGEAIITSEGDVQISFHQPLPGSADDMRFSFTVDPNFAPKDCVPTADGTGVEAKPIDGDWVEGWSGNLGTDEGGGRLFYLNANAYQFAPKETYEHNLDPATKDLRRWNFPNEWMAGYTEAKFGDDRLFMRSTRYGDPASYLSYENSQNSLGGIDLTPDVYSGDLYYCQSWRPEYDICLEPARLQTYRSCRDAAELLVETADRLVAREQCAMSFADCLEEDEANFSGRRSNGFIGIGISFYGFGSALPASGALLSGYQQCAADYAFCAYSATDTATCEAEFVSCHDEAYATCRSETESLAYDASDAVASELKKAGVPGYDEADANGLLPIQPRVDTNDWRTPDGTAAGVADWMEVNFNWVKFDEGSELEPGGAATGSFQLVYDAADSASRLFIRGKFEVSHFRKDTWTTKYLPPVKFEEFGTTECGGEAE